MKNYFLLLSLILIAASIAIADEIKVGVYKPTTAENEFDAALDTIVVYGSTFDVARAFRDKYPDDIAVQIRASDILVTDYTEEVRTHYKKRAEDNPKSIVDLYMAGRYAELIGDRREYAEKIFAVKPGNYWGHLLMATSFYEEEDRDFKKAEGELRKAVAADNSKPFALELLADMLAGTGRMAEAEDVFIALGKMLPDDFFPVQQRLMLNRGNLTKQLELIDEYLARNPNEGLALDIRARVCRELGDWNGYITSMQRAVAVEPDATNFYNLACGFSLNNEPDSAFANLRLAADKGMTDLEHYTNDDDLIPLREDARWPELLETVEEKHKEELRQQAISQSRPLAPEQKERAVERNADSKAPDFSLDDLSGNTVNLSELKGKVVILDFWATWCGPCRKTMPLLDGFYNDNRNPNVLVYGVNVWERNGDVSGVKPYIEKSGYKFPILMGAAETAQAYGVSGIPTLFVIDKEGKIAYRHVGYNPQVVQLLKAQTEELLK